MVTWTYWAIRPKPWQTLNQLAGTFALIFKAEYLGSHGPDMGMWRIPKTYRGQWVGALSGRFSPFEGVDFFEEIDFGED
jgi:hypothetical protein